MTGLVPLEKPLPTPERLPDPLPAVVYLVGLSQSGRKSIEQDLHRLAGAASGGTLDAFSFPWWRLRYEHTAALRAALINAGYAPSYVNHHLNALRSVLKTCWRLELMTAEDYHRAVDVQPVAGSTELAGREVTPGELQALVQVCQEDDRPQGARDGALLGVAFTAGLRVHEIISLELEDYNPDTGELFVRRGKGSKQRRTYLAPGARRALEAWIAKRGWEPGAMFVTVNKSGRLIGGRMSRSAIRYRFDTRAQQAGVAKFSPHDGRRTWIGNLFSAGVDSSVIQRLAGHSSADTTSRYDRRPEEAKRQAVQRLNFPWSDS